MKQLLFLLVAFACTNSHAQKPPKQAEINKMMKEMEANPEVKRAMQQAGINSLSDVDDETVIWKLPVKRSKELAYVSATVLSAATIKSYTLDVNTRVQQALTTSQKTSVKQAADFAKSDPLLLSRAAIAYWYKNNAAVALGLASKAASLSSQVEVLNTLSALLNLMGLEQKAIPLLQYTLSQQAGNATLLNNLGQAYLGLGDIKKAEEYLLKAVAAVGRHVEANKSLGLIYKLQGQQAKAKQCLQKSLEGGYTPTAAEAARSLGIDDETIDKFVIDYYTDVKAPEYFNNYKYEVPELCENVAEARKLDALHKQFRSQMKQEMNKCDKEIEAEVEQMTKKVEQIQGNIQAGHFVEFVPSPFFEKSKRMLMYWANKFQQYGINELYPQYMKMSQREQELYYKYNEEYIKINTSKIENPCPSFDALANRYLPLYAINQRQFMEKMLPPVRGYLTEMMYWFQFANVIGNGRMMVLAYKKSYFEILHNLSRDSKIIFPACSDAPENDIDTLAAGEKKDDECPFNMKINLVVGEISMDCKKFGIEMSAGLSFSAEKEFASGETTLAIGIGLEGKLPVPIPIINAGGGVGISEQLYVTFNRDNNPSDIGIKMEVKASGGLGVEGGPLSTNIGGIETKAGYSLGLNTGWKFEGSAPSGSGAFTNAFK